MKSTLAQGFLIPLLTVAALGSCQPHHSTPMEPMGTSDTIQIQEIISDGTAQGETASPTIEGNLIKVNNKLCAVSRTPMAEKTIGKFKGQVAYEGSNPKFRGKTMEFNYCCGMCQIKFPEMFKADPDAILRFHGLL